MGLFTGTDREDEEWLMDYEAAESDGANDAWDGVFMEYDGDEEGDFIESEYDNDPSLGGYWNGNHGVYDDHPFDW